MKMKRKKRCLLKMRKTFLMMVSKLMMTSNAEHGCYWFVISLVYLNMVNFVHINSTVLSFWQDCLPLGKYHISCVYIYCWSCFLLPHTQHKQGKVIVQVYIYIYVCVLKRLNHTLVVNSSFQTLTIDRRIYIHTSSTTAFSRNAIVVEQVVHFFLMHTIFM